MSTPEKDENGIRWYNQWAGNSKGRREDIIRCIEEVWPPDRWGLASRYQCKRKRGFGPNGLYCKQHAKKYEE